jgi:hypothetical protein
MSILMVAMTVATAIGVGLSLYKLTAAETPPKTLCVITTVIVFLASWLFAGHTFADIAFNYTRFSKIAGPLFLSLFAVAALLVLYCGIST